MGGAGEEMPRTPSHTGTHTHLLPPQTHAEDHQVPTSHQTGLFSLIYLPQCLDLYFIAFIFSVTFFTSVSFHSLFTFMFVLIFVCLFILLIF